MPHQCRQLKAKRLPSASRHQDKQILSGECIQDDFFLQRPELFVAKMFLQGTEQFHDFLNKTLRAFSPSEFCPTREWRLRQPLSTVPCLWLRTRRTAFLRFCPARSDRWSFGRFRSKTTERSLRVYRRHSNQVLRRGCIHSATDSSGFA